MENIRKYLLEELKLNDQKLQKLNDIQLSLIKFYFTTVFSLGTIIIALYNYGVFKKTDILLPWFLLLPLLIFGWVVYFCLKKILIEYNSLERARNEISEFFIYGELKKKYYLFGSPLTSFYTLISWMVTINFFAFIYLAVPYFQITAIRTAALVILAVAFTGIITSIVLVSLGSARQRARDALRLSGIGILRVVLELYYNDNGKYPVTNDIKELSKYLSPKYIDEVPVDPLNKDNFYYQYESKDGKTYSLKYVLEKEGEQYVTSETR